jgi:hypothetical protein
MVASQRRCCPEASGSTWRVRRGWRLSVTSQARQRVLGAGPFEWHWPESGQSRELAPAGSEGLGEPPVRGHHLASRVHHHDRVADGV